MAFLSMALLCLGGGAAIVLLDHLLGPTVSSRIPYYTDDDHQGTPMNVRDFSSEPERIEIIALEYDYHIMQIPHRRVGVLEMPFSEVRDCKPTTVSCSSCVVCLEEFGEKEMCAVLPVCRHVYHPACVQQWFRRQKTCPLCRFPL